MWEVADIIPTKEEWYDALLERHGEEIQQKLSSAVIAICGLGGLGSNIAVALARAGIGKLILIDFDIVDITNLHRQQYKATQIGMNKTDALKENLLEIAPYVTVETYSIRITENNATRFLVNADVICEAFDDAECKAMLANLILEKMPNKFLIASSGMAGMGSANAIRTRRVLKNFYICGDEISDVQTEGSLISSRVMLCASHQAHIALRIIAEQYDT